MLALPLGCLGGQTGQPTSANCDGPPPDRMTGGLSPAEVLVRFEGEHVSPLGWFADEAHATQGEPAAPGAAPEDEITVTLAYDGAPVSDDCGQAFTEAHMTLTTRDSGLSESGVTRVIAGEQAAGCPLQGGPYVLAALSSERVGARAWFFPSNDGTLMVGELYANLGAEGEGSPGAYARFPPGGSPCIY